jgi:predicted RNase H-like HicB family nuclease
METKPMPHTYALIHEENGVFGISFPDFPGCVSTGRSFEEAIAKRIEALNFLVAGMVEDGDPIPRLRGMKELQAALDEGAAGATAVYLAFELPDGRQAKLGAGEAPLELADLAHHLARLARRHAAVRERGAERGSDLRAALRHADQVRDEVAAGLVGAALQWHHAVGGEAGQHARHDRLLRPELEKGDRPGRQEVRMSVALAARDHAVGEAGHGLHAGRPPGGEHQLARGDLELVRPAKRPPCGAFCWGFAPTLDNRSWNWFHRWSEKRAREISICFEPLPNNRRRLHSPTSLKRSWQSKCNPPGTARASKLPQHRCRCPRQSRIANRVDNAGTFPGQRRGQRGQRRIR